MSTIYDGMNQWLEAALNASYGRHNVLSGNLANVDTPGYLPRDVEFTQALDAALAHKDSIDRFEVPTSTERPGVTIGQDGNGVDLDTEIANMASNRLFYDLASEIVSRRLALIRYAINEGGR